MHGCKSISIPLLVNYKLSLRVNPSNEAKRMELSRTLYASIMGNLNINNDLYKTKQWER